MSEPQGTGARAREFWRLYQPYLATVLVLGLLAAVTVTRDDDSPVETGASGEVFVPGDTTVTQTGDADASSPTAEPDGQVTSESRLQGGETRTVGVAAPVAGTGAGTTAAKANPNCDAKTGKQRIPSIYAPECVTFWAKGADNGGRTWPGVSKDAIRIVFYSPSSSAVGNVAINRDEEQAGNYNQIWVDFADLYNTHLDLWGRKVQLIFFEGTGTDEVAQRADAVTVANDIKPFMSIYPQDARMAIYAAEVAARGIVVYETNVLWKDTQAQPGMRWGVTPDDRSQILHIAEYVGKRLVGRPAIHAGTPDLQLQQRAFGLVHPDSWDLKMFNDEARRFKVPIADAIAYTEGDTASYQERARTVIGRLKSKNVNNVIAAFDPFFTIVLTKEATAQTWFPEWTITGWAHQDVTLFGRLYDQQQWANAFGPGPVQTLTAVSKSEWVELYQWHMGFVPSDNAAAGQAWFVLREVFAGLSMAGPHLTPTTFKQAMFSKRPNGGTWCGCLSHIGVSFGRHRANVPWDDYTANDDMTENYWDPNQTGEDEIGVVAAGVYMKVAGGRRYNPGDWPSTDPKVFNPDGAVVKYDDYPKGEHPPQYPHQSH